MLVMDGDVIYFMATGVSYINFKFRGYLVCMFFKFSAAASFQIVRKEVLQPQKYISTGIDKQKLSVYNFKYFFTHSF